jgi:DNA-binding transcriptional ArsR family regulator
MATRAWRGEEVRRSTTFLDLQQAVACSTRVAIVVVLSAGTMHVSLLRQKLGFSLSLLSSHLKVLRDAAIVDYEEEGTRHAYSLLAAARVRVVEAGLAIRLKGDDGSTLAGTVPATSPVMRLLASALRAAAKVQETGATHGTALRPVAASRIKPKRKTAYVVFRNPIRGSDTAAERRGSCD